MLHLFLGTDSAKARAALAKQLAAGGLPETRITDAHTLDDLHAALSGGGMFARARAVVLDGVLANGEMREVLSVRLATLAASGESFYVCEEKPDAAVRKLLEKHAQTVVVFDAPKRQTGGSNVFALADAMNRGDKKNLWIGYQRQLYEGNAPEAIHGVLFWGAKKALLAAKEGRAAARPARLVAQLAELPHKARRDGEDMEYALERFVLGV